MAGLVNQDLCYGCKEDDLAEVVCSQVLEDQAVQQLHAVVDALLLEACLVTEVYQHFYQSPPGFNVGFVHHFVCVDVCVLVSLSHLSCVRSEMRTLNLLCISIQHIEMLYCSKMASMPASGSRIVFKETDPSQVPDLRALIPSTILTEVKTHSHVKLCFWSAVQIASDVHKP